jgi:glyoxylase-like metal-dependent hydrolase (beta-lactamase superfamily II)
LTFAGSLTLWLGKRRVEISHPGRGHTAGDTIAWVPDAGVLFSGDLVEYKSACYCGDAFLHEWPQTIARLAALDAVALVPGRGDALVGYATVKAAMAGTADFLNALFGTAERAVARGLSLKETAAAIRAEMDKPFGDYAIYEHCLPFNVSRAYDEARGIDWPRIWTDERDVAMWTALQD